MASKQTYEDIINHTFNMLTVTGLAGRRSSGEQLFYCDCSCGTKNHLAAKHQLITGGLKSCGCLRKDQDNIIGNRYNKVIVISLNGRRRGAQLFLCRCNCGNIITTTKDKLLRGEVKSCGCLLKEIKDKYKDLIGQKFGKLKVIKKLGAITTRIDIFWECKCECGNMTNVTTGNLTHGFIKSCGCISRDLIRNYRISIGKDPNVSVKSDRVQLREKLKKLKLDVKTFIRDNKTCQLCGSKAKDINAHHIIPIHEDESKALDINNLITLCKKCHFEKAHDKNYKKINVLLQEQFIKQNSLL